MSSVPGSNRWSQPGTIQGWSLSRQSGQPKLYHNPSHWAPLILSFPTRSCWVRITPLSWISMVLWHNPSVRCEMKVKFLKEALSPPLKRRRLGQRHLERKWGMERVDSNLCMRGHYSQYNFTGVNCGFCKIGCGFAIVSGAYLKNHGQIKVIIHSSLPNPPLWFQT